MRNKLYSLAGIAVILIIFLFSNVNAQKYSTYKKTDVKKVEIAATRLNVRSGAGIDFKPISTVKKGAVLDVLGLLDDWYVVHLPDNSIGVISSEYVIEYTDDAEQNLSLKASSSKINLKNDGSVLSDNAATMINLINKERTDNGFSALTVDSEIMYAAQLKADDMVINKYLGHNSKRLGSPFTMLKRLGIVYRAAGENIVANESIESAHQQIIQSKNHLANVLNPRFQKIGIGIADDSKYGKIIVQLFVE